MNEVPMLRRLLPLLLSLLLGTSLMAPAQAAAPKPAPAAAIVKTASVEGITEYRLHNGLKLLLFPDATQDTITVNMTYLVGSRHEGYGESGMAHLLEHMLFKGTPKHPDIKGEFQRQGARFNFPMRFITFTDLTFTLNNASTAALTSSLLASLATLKVYWPRADDISVPFSVTRIVWTILYGSMILNSPSRSQSLAKCFDTGPAEHNLPEQQQQIRIYRRRSHHMYTRQVPRRHRHVRRQLIHQQQGVLTGANTHQKLHHLTGLGLVQRDLAHHDDLAGVNTVGESTTQRQLLHLAVHTLGIAARQRPKNNTTSAPQRALPRASARPAGALLAPRLSTTARHRRLVLRAGTSGPNAGQICHHGILYRLSASFALQP
jgi:hypothetical protein